MKTPLHIEIYKSVSELPENWNDLAIENLFLSIEYLKVLELSAPSNMYCHFIGLFSDGELVGIAIAQLLDLNQLASFGERDKCLKTAIRNIFFNKLCSHILILGNNMLTGQNAISFSNTIEEFQILLGLKSAAEKLKAIFQSKGIKVHVTTYKDFSKESLPSFKLAGFDDNFQYSTQPNMLFDIPNHWRTEQDYIDALSKKYRDQYKRARKKAQGVEKRKMQLNDIIQYEDTIYDLYYHVAQNAHFNTFS